MQKKTREEIDDEWANSMLDEATDEMDDQGIHITPASLSTYFGEEYGMPLDPHIAERWLQEQEWYQHD